MCADSPWWSSIPRWCTPSHQVVSSSSWLVLASSLGWGGSPQYHVKPTCSNMPRRGRGGTQEWSGRRRWGRTGKAYCCWVCCRHCCNFFVCIPSFSLVVPVLRWFGDQIDLLCKISHGHSSCWSELDWCEHEWRPCCQSCAEMRIEPVKLDDRFICDGNSYSREIPNSLSQGNSEFSLSPLPSLSLFLLFFLLGENLLAVVSFIGVCVLCWRFLTPPLGAILSWILLVQAVCWFVSL